MEIQIMEIRDSDNRGSTVYIYIYIYTNLSIYTNLLLKLTCVTY